VTKLHEIDLVGRYLTARVEEGWTPGAAWWVEGEGGPVSHGAVGRVRSEAPQDRLGEATPFDLASLTKPLSTALLLVLLERDGLLDLSRPASGFLGRLDGSAFANATLLDLATHRSGLVAWRPLYLRASDADGYVSQIAEESPAVPHGETLYSDLGYILLGQVIEQATGRSLRHLFRELVSAPLRLARIGYAADRRDFPDAAATERGNAYERAMAGAAGDGHAWRTHVLQGEVHDANAHGLGGVAGHAGLFGTAAEVAAIVREIVCPSELGLDDSCRRRLLQPAAGSKGRSVGMVTAAFSRAARCILPDEAPGHTGFTGTSLWIDPGGRRFYVLLTNRVHPVVGRREFNMVRRGFHRAAVRAVEGASTDLPLQ
jgi:CubicO group peptidase (beta-lactamase class C family)